MWKVSTVWITTNWKLVRDGNTQSPCLSLYAGQEAIVRTRHGTMDWFKIGKRVHQGCLLSTSLFNLHSEYIMWNAGLGESQAGIKIAGKNNNSLKYADDTSLMAEIQHQLDHGKSKRVPEKHLLRLYWLYQSLWLCGSQQTVENSERDGNTRPPDLPPEKSVCRSRSNI